MVLEIEIKTIKKVFLPPSPILSLGQWNKSEILALIDFLPNFSKSRRRHYRDVGHGKKTAHIFSLVTDFLGTLKS